MTNNPNSYENQKLRGLKRKYEYVMKRDGKCERCGYNKNFSALQFHHIDPSTKKFTLDARTLERKTDEEIIEEFNKCELLCSNCHQELHHPFLILDNYDEIKKLGSGINYRIPHNLDLLGVDE